MEEGINNPNLVKKFVKIQKCTKPSFQFTKLQKIPLSMRKHFPKDFFSARIPSEHIKWQPPKKSEISFVDKDLSSRLDTPSTQGYIQQISSSLHNQSHTNATPGKKSVQHSINKTTSQNNEEDLREKSKLVPQTWLVEKKNEKGINENKSTLSTYQSPYIPDCSSKSHLDSELHIQPLYLRKDFFNSDESLVKIRNILKANSEYPLKRVRLSKRSSIIQDTKCQFPPKFFPLSKFPHLNLIDTYDYKKYKVTVDSVRISRNTSINSKAPCSQSNKSILKKVHIENFASPINPIKAAAKPGLSHLVVKLHKTPKPITKTTELSSKFSPEKIESVNDITFGNDEY